MTLIMGAVKDGKRYLASDSQGSNRFTKGIYKNNKIFAKGDMLIGGCGSYKQLQLLEHNFTPPERSTVDDISKYMFTKFAPAVKQFFKDNGVLTTRDGQDSNDSGAFIIMYGDRIFILQSDLALLEPNENFTCVGSGEYHAYAAIRGLTEANPKMAMPTVFKKALAITTDVVMSVGGEMHLITKEVKQ